MISKYATCLFFLMCTVILHGCDRASLRLSSCYERLGKHTTFLGSLHQDCQDACVRFIKKSGFTCQHSLLCSCMHDMQQKKSLKPLLQAWTSFQQCPCVEDHDLFLQEYASSIFVSYLALTTAQKRVLLVDIVMLYIKVSALPLDKILDLLDDYCSLVYEIGQNYTLKEPHSAMDWLREYWWVPAIVGGVSLVKLVNWLRNRK